MTFASYVRNITKPSYHTYICRSRQQWSFNFRPHQFIKTRDSNLFLFHSYSTSNSKPKIGFIGWYLGKLESRPIATKTITTSLIYAAADLTAQVFSSSSGSFDLIRTSRMAAYGLLLLGPSQHIWFNFMSKALPKRDVLSTLKKTFLGQAFYGPANAIVFFSYNAALQGENRAEIAARLKRDVLPTLKAGLCYWPICDFFTYKSVPPHLQPLVNSSCAYLWTIYLTYMASLQKVSSN
ncbi:protein SYM1-like isoform X2 [Euphorbia lathyris]|uniref:protein SYM1-like isoform X2 n=1 Tax=Euphorbia lathyris TaxID=212925 RepID=UPI0033138FA5